MVWRGWASLLPCVAALLLLVPAPAQAKPGYVVSGGFRRAELNLKGSHGYAIQVALHGRRRIELSASNGSSVAVYLLPPVRARDDRIEARFPGLGRVSMEFRPVGPAQREPGFFPQCRGGETVKQAGYYEGLISLRGERGYTAVHRTRAPGQIFTMAKEICKRSIFGDPRQGPKEDVTHVTRLFAYSRSEGRLTSFSATTTSFPSESFSATSFLSAISERRGRMSIVRITVANGEQSDLLPGDTDPFPLSATVSPPDPFSGSAAFQRMPHGDNSWSGSLSAPLPGKGTVALAGQGFSVRLCQRCSSSATGRRSRRRMEFLLAVGRKAIASGVPQGSSGWVRPSP